MICKLRQIAVSVPREKCDKAIDDLEKSEWKATGIYGSILVTHQESIPPCFIILLTMCVKRIIQQF